MHIYLLLISSWCKGHGLIEAMACKQNTLTSLATAANVTRDLGRHF